MLVRTLLVLESPELRKRVREALEPLDVMVGFARLRGDFWDRLSRENTDLLFVSRGLLPDPIVTTISQLRKLPDQPEIVVFLDGEGAEERADLLAAGCLAVLEEEISPRLLRDSLAALIERRTEWLAARFGSGRGQPRALLGDFVSSSSAMQSFLDMARRVVPTDSSLLVLGETGVGKEHLARAIHNEGPRASGPFIAVNCGALPEGLLESELFGHEEGAFTGATRSRRGYFELAHRGTIFLDEIAEMPLHLQVKLLRVLQEYSIHRVGSERSIEVDVRVIAATNRDLVAEVDARRFRQDLYYRLGVVTLTIPPLRERREDIPALVERYLETFRRRFVRSISGIDPEALDVVVRYDWPGNVRELMNVIERAVLLGRGERISLEDLPDAVAGDAGRGPGRERTAVAGPNGISVPEEWLAMPWAEARREILQRFERAYLSRLLRECGGRIGEAARRAGIQPRSLFEKMRAHGLRKESYKPGRRTPS
jgi:DNA-binding NtrC family response regulator